MDLATVLKPELENHNLPHKLSACVKHGGSNLRTCTSVLRTTTDCRPLGLEECFEGTCFAHILSGACSGALKASVDSEFRHISSGMAIGELQACIRWTKKSGKGREAWSSSCLSRVKAQRKMPTPVKTRFASSVVMMSMMLVYRDVARHCFSNQDSIELRNRVQSNSTWESIGTIVTVLEPFMQAVYEIQGRKWLLSDGVACVARLYVKYRDAASATVVVSSTASEFTREIFLYKRKLARVLKESLEDVISPLRTFRSLGGKFLHHYLSLVLDPFYKSNKAMKSIMMPLHSGSTVDVKYLAKTHDDEVLIPQLKSVYRYKKFKEQGSGETSDTDSDERGEHDAFEQDENDTDEIFGDEAESAEERLSNNIKAELSSFRKEKYASSTEEKLSWFKTKEAIFPNVSTLARQILWIPATQIENERVFSLAGRIATP